MVPVEEVAGEPIVLVGPESPELVTTVTPAATAASSASCTGSFRVSGIGRPPKDWLSTSTWSTFTAHSMAWMIWELKKPGAGPDTLSAAMLAPGATPRIRIVQPGGSGWAGLTNEDRS